MALYRGEPVWQRENNPKPIFTGDPLAIIYNEGFWRLSKVSPLYNLQYGTVKLKQYASKIRQGIVSAVTASSSVKYVVQIEEHADLKYSEDDASGLVINVLSSTQDNTSKSKISYSGILLTWGESISLENATHLPYLLEKGEIRIGNAVKTALQTMFDCNIKQFSFTQQQLLQFGFSFIEVDSSRSMDAFSLTYKIPQADHKEKLNFAFEVGDVNIIWNGIKDDVVKTSELVTLAYQILQNQIFNMIMLDITVFDLTEVAMPRAEVKSNGVIKMKSPEIVNCVFVTLNEICNMYEKDTSSSSDNAS